MNLPLLKKYLIPGRNFLDIIYNNYFSNFSIICFKIIVYKMKNIEVIIRDRLFYIRAEELHNQIWFHWKGRIFVLDKKKRKLSASRKVKKASHENFILSPMPGQIVKVLVTPGKEVKENQTLIILSSMKMEYIIKSPAKAVVKYVKVKEGEQVAAHQELILFR